MKNASCLSRRSFLAASAIAMAGTATAQQGDGAGFPSKPIRLIVAFPPGGSTTPVARLVGQKLTERLGVPVMVDNKPGANGLIASEELLRTPGDGHTMLMVVNTHSLNPLTMASLPYDNNRDFAPISTLYRFELVLVAHPSVAAGNLREFIALAKANPSQLNFAVGDNVGQTHLASETFNHVAGTKIQIVPFTGSGPALTSTMGGHAQVAFATPTAVISLIKAGKLKAFAVSGSSRVPQLPDLPTFDELGLKNVDVGGWAGLLAPATTPKPVVNRLGAEIAAIMALPEVRESLGTMGLSSYAIGNEPFTALIKSETVKFDTLIRSANIKLTR
ncbi:MAG: tripartite tricarboxylate transporter substrate binding protein [Betaproteobacteria bacterium]|nr:tripartite tricarboxylate transporter substrate binding protein [Betaproteobacteria bacterium]